MIRRITYNAYSGNGWMVKHESISVYSDSQQSLKCCIDLQEYKMCICEHYSKIPHPPCLKIEALHQLTNGGDDCYGKVKRASEFPLSPGAMGLSLQHHSFDFAVVDLGEAVLLLHLVALLLQDASAGGLRLRLQRVKHRGADQQVGEHAEDERQGPDVLLLHPRRRRQKGARLQQSICATGLRCPVYVKTRVSGCAHRDALDASISKWLKLAFSHAQSSPK